MCPTRKVPPQDSLDGYYISIHQYCTKRVCCVSWKHSSENQLLFPAKDQRPVATILYIQEHPNYPSMTSFARGDSNKKKPGWHRRTNIGTNIESWTQTGSSFSIELQLPFGAMKAKQYIRERQGRRTDEFPKLSLSMNEELLVEIAHTDSTTKDNRGQGSNHHEFTLVEIQIACDLWQYSHQRIWWRVHVRTW